MPRQALLDVPGALHHIMVRGINKADIFNDDQGISSVMRKLLSWYAQYYNRRHKRTGHLFENRYKSILCDEDNYLLSLVRYIHLNPLRAGIVKTIEGLNSYPWSGHRTIIGKATHSWMDGEYVLAQFGNTRRKALHAYRAFMREGAGQGQIKELTGGGFIRSQGGWSQVLSMQRRGQKEDFDERILGGGDFVHTILKQTEESQLRQVKARRAGKTIQQIIDEECRRQGIGIIELKGGGKRRNVSDTRARIAVRCRAELGLTAAAIARHVGVNTSAVARAIERMEERDDS